MIVMAYVVMTYMVIAYIVMAYIDVAYILMATRKRRGARCLHAARHAAYLRCA